MFSVSIYSIMSFRDGEFIQRVAYEWYDLSMNALYALYFFAIACLALVKSQGNNRCTKFKI